MKKSINIIGMLFLLLGLFILIFSFSKKEILSVINNLEVEEKKETNNYFLILEIPKISLKKEIYEKNDQRNDVNKNIYLHPISSFMNYIVLAAHSGYGVHAYFQDLYKLEINDYIYLYYNEQKYIYQIKKIDTQAKSGTLNLSKEITNALILITCTKNDETTQTIYYGALKSVKKV